VARAAHAIGSLVSRDSEREARRER
jgi:hypothetical protein